MSDRKHQKIKSIDEIAFHVAQLKRSGVTVGMAHGTFDLFHAGHLRHLREARRQVDFLVVTVTADPHVNKGPGRPVFNYAARAEMLAELQCVNMVGVNNSPHSVDALRAIKPDLYFKGREYATESNDATQNIKLEREAVEESGGKIAFTDGEVFSSSALLNKHFELYPPELETYLASARARNLLPRIIEALESIKRLRVLFVGDAIIDEYDYVSTLGKTPKENIIATLFKRKEEFTGGIQAAANHLKTFCGKVDVLSPMQEDRYPTRKVRFVDQDYNRKLFEVYHMNESPLSGDIELEFAQRLEQAIPHYDVVVVADFGHGLITPLVQEKLRAAKFLAVNAQSNSANMGFNLITKYQKADYICIDAPEARLAVSDKFSELRIVAQKLTDRIDCERVAITHGRFGCSMHHGGDHVDIPAFTQTVVDTIGAGDAFLAVTSVLAAVGADIELLGFVGNAVGALKVGIVGHRQSVEKVPLLKYVTAMLK